MTRHGDWIQTFSGQAFWPLDPRPEDVSIVDIAHALAHLCRYGGHTRLFYSVAEHSVLMAGAVAPQHRLWALLHDASEAYLVDLPRPIKRAIPSYKAAETAVMLAICARFGLPAEMPHEVHLADGRILTDEREQNMAPPPMPWAAEEQVEALGVTLECWSPVRAEVEFMTLFDKLTEGRFASSAPFVNKSHRGGQRNGWSHG
ncbi:phosphohydrolase [Bosea lathyri]|uniref:Phosphohydrolase n=1 Tax=Bosea lathyri TaxID=1036778 RepID=A0A1H6BEI7_9HYPH|nr:phosphohydrolase [Bosea lathyri]SEG58974.1 hypothetical protein SAMN04488115_107167 [Bosea lathyri]